MVGGSLPEQLNNPELDVETSSPDVQTRRRRLQLRTATIRMRAAALGHDLELEDSGEPRAPRASPSRPPESQPGPRPLPSTPPLASGSAVIHSFTRSFKARLLNTCLKGEGRKAGEGPSFHSWPNGGDTETS